MYSICQTTRGRNALSCPKPLPVPVLSFTTIYCIASAEHTPPFLWGARSSITCRSITRKGEWVFPILVKKDNQFGNFPLHVARLSTGAATPLGFPPRCFAAQLPLSCLRLSKCEVVIEQRPNLLLSVISVGHTVSLVWTALIPRLEPAQTSELTLLPPSVFLSPKQLRIAQLVTQGNTNSDIAAAIGTTEDVIKNYLRDIYDETGMSSRPGTWHSGTWPIHWIPKFRSSFRPPAPRLSSLAIKRGSHPSFTAPCRACCQSLPQ